jgi:hypothetical protein
MSAALQLSIFDQFSTFAQLNLSKRGLSAFFNNFEVSESGCWLWTGGIGLDGYGHARSRDTNYSAARVAWLCWRGPIPLGYEPDHLCPWRHCICPEHLELITHLENMRRGRIRNLTRTQCWRGHELTPENVRISKGWRVCRVCKPEVVRRAA